MLAVTIGQAVASAAANAIFDAFKSEVHQGLTHTKDSLMQAFRGGEVPADVEVPVVEGEGAAWVTPLLFAGAAAAATVVLVPKLRNAALDFNDGALRKLGASAREKWGSFMAPGSSDESAAEAIEPEVQPQAE